MAMSVQPFTALPLRTIDQVPPASSERNTPVRVAAHRRCELRGLTRIFIV
jgi:hypothetical protein